MKRIYTEHLRKYLSRKIILISGPRQSGKTTLAKVLDKDHDYLNFDEETHRSLIKDRSWDRKKKLIIFDELHKMPRFKQWLKGVYDTEGTSPAIVVTGSARLDTFKKVGDSLAGRYFGYQIHPLDVRELIQTGFSRSPEEIIERLMLVGGFPEPFLEGTTEFYHLWKKTHLDIMLRQDMIDLDIIKSIRQIEVLIELLKTKVGSTISYNSLAQDLQVSDKTIKRWLDILEDMYVIFKITPYSKKISRAILKQPKYYFYDIARIPDEGARFENLVAASLLKEVHFRSDCLGQEWGLHFVAKKGQGEIDFLITQDKGPHTLVEAKLSDAAPSPAFRLFEQELPGIKKVQLVKNLRRETTFPHGPEVRHPGNWLSSW